MISSISAKYIRYFSNTKKNYYDILNIGSNATSHEIKLAYYKLSKQYHPDLNKDIDTTIFRELNQAYEVLGNPETRIAYDRSLGLGDSSISAQETQDPTSFYQERQKRQGTKSKRYYTHTVSNFYHEPQKDKESDRMKILKQRKEFDRAFTVIVGIAIFPALIFLFKEIKKKS